MVPILCVNNMSVKYAVIMYITDFVIYNTYVHVANTFEEHHEYLCNPDSKAITSGEG